jgi:hypothetical protein
MKNRSRVIFVVVVAYRVVKHCAMFPKMYDLFSLQGVTHGLMYYRDTEAKCRHLKY